MLVLTYHTVSNSRQFESQMKWLLASGYNLIDINHFLNQINSATPSLGYRDVLITFDDGDVTVYHNAYPILKKYNIPSVLFVITSLISTQEPFWWEEINYYSNNSIPLRYVKALPNKERLKLVEDLKRNSSKPLLSQSQLSWEQLFELEDSGMAIANHSHTHPMFNRINKEEITSELTKSFNILEQKGFKNANVFAYPNGNFNEETLQALESKGFIAAFLFDHNICKELNKCNRFKISRLSLNDYTPMWKFKLILSGYHSKILDIRIRMGI